MIHGQNHQGSTCMIARQLAEKIGGETQEFFLPRDFDQPCLGCYTCFKADLSRCPHFEKLELIVKAILEADLLILESPVYVYHASGQMMSLLDHFGTQEIWMCFSYYATHERGVSEALDFYRNDYKKSVNRQRKLLNFEESRRIFEEKYRFQRDFIKRLKVESEGGYMPTKDMTDPDLFE